MKRGVWISVVLVLWLAGSGVQGSESFRQTLGDAAAVVAKVAEARGAEAVGVGDFTGPPSFGSAAGAGFRRVLIEELNKKKVPVKRTGGVLGIQGKYRPKIEGNMVSLQLDVSVVDKNGEVLEDLDSPVEIDWPAGSFPTDEKRKIDLKKGVFSLRFSSPNDWSGTTALCEALGGNVEMKPFNKPEAKGTDVLEKLTHSTAVIKDSWASASPDCPFYLAVLVNGKHLPLRIEDGQPWVDLKKDDVFQLRFHNGANFPVAASFHLDGVSTFAFSEVRLNAAGETLNTPNADIGQPKFSRFIAERGSQPLVIRGWHKTMHEVTEFKMVDFENSAFARVGGTGGLGTISVTVRASWLKSASPPPDEVVKDFTNLIATSPGPAAGEGERIREESREDKNAREYGRTRAVITIRYAKPE